METILSLDNLFTLLMLILLQAVLGFDNLQTRPPAKDIDGWQHHYIVLDIPDESSRLLFGLLLAGKGELYVKNMALEAVDNSTQTTNMLK